MRVPEKSATSANVSVGKGTVTPDDVKVVLQNNPAKVKALVEYLEPYREKGATWSKPHVTNVVPTTRPDVFAATVYVAQEQQTLVGKATIDRGSKVAVDAQGNVKKWTRQELEAMAPNLPLGYPLQAPPKGADKKHPSFEVDMSGTPGDSCDRDVHLIGGRAYVAMDTGLPTPTWYPVGPLAE